MFLPIRDERSSTGTVSMLGYKNQNSSYRSSLIKGNEQSPVEWGIRVNRNSRHPSKSNKKSRVKSSGEKTGSSSYLPV